MAKQIEYVKRNVVKSKTYNVYSFKNGQTEFLGQETTTDERISSSKLAKKYGVDKVITMLDKQEIEVYGVPVETFMEQATLLETKTNGSDEQ